MPYSAYNFRTGRSKTFLYSSLSFNKLTFFTLHENTGRVKLHCYNFPLSRLRHFDPTMLRTVTGVSGCRMIDRVAIAIENKIVTLFLLPICWTLRNAQARPKISPIASTSPIITAPTVECNFRRINERIQIGPCRLSLLVEGPLSTTPRNRCNRYCSRHLTIV